MNYLTEAEIPEYCGLVAGVTMDHIAAASALIDAFLGCSLEPTQHTEKVQLIFKRCGDVRGKLKHYPRLSVDEITCTVRSPFGGNTLTLDEDAIEFDGDDSLYFSFRMPRQLLFQRLPRALTVKYTSGYDPVPESVKRACGMLAGNIKQMGGVLRWKSRDDYDIKVTLGNDGVFSSEVKGILAGVSIG